MCDARRSRCFYRDRFKGKECNFGTVLKVFQPLHIAKNPLSCQISNPHLQQTAVNMFLSGIRVALKCLCFFFSTKKENCWKKYLDKSNSTGIFSISHLK